MKKVLSVVLAMLITASMAVMLTGCGDKSKFIGKWSAELNLSETINESLGTSADAEAAKYLKFDDFNIVLNFEFKKDGTYSLEADADAFEKTLENTKKTFKDGMTKYLEATIASSGLDMTVEEMLEASDTTIDKLVDESLNDDTFSGMFEEFDAEGNFEVEDGKLYLSEDKDSKIDKKVYDKYEIVSSDEIKLTESVGGDEEDAELTKVLYPLTLKRK